MFISFAVILAGAGLFVVQRRKQLRSVLGWGNIFVALFMVWLLVIAYYEGLDLNLLDIATGTIVVAVSGVFILRSKT